MRLIPLVLMILSGPAFGGDNQIAKATVGVYAEYVQPLSAKVRTGMQREVNSILSPLGFDIQWRDAAAGGNEVWADLALIQFQGDCNPQNKVYSLFSPGPLGWTRITDGIIQPFAFIDCDRIGAMIQSVSVHADERLFARAAGRVVAHELYHIFVRTSHHGGSGVGKQEFTTRDLLSDHFTFQPVQARALRIRSERRSNSVLRPAIAPRSSAARHYGAGAEPASGLYFGLAGFSG